ncbi:MAG: hypothetical protein ABIR33_07345 [Pyrinomonadaceae bacterium]
MFCPKCALQNGDEVLYCRGCGADLASVRTILEASARGSTTSPKVHLSDRQLRRMRRRGIDGSETPLTLAERAIEMQSGAIRGLILSGGFAFITYLIYQNPPVGGIFWLLPLAFTIFFFAATLSRFLQASMIKKLLRQTEEPSNLTDVRQEYLEPGQKGERPQLWSVPPASIYETDELEKSAHPESITDATTRHLR